MNKFYFQLYFFKNYPTPSFHMGWKGLGVLIFVIIIGFIIASIFLK
ncbi:DUF6366 family protein [Priestia megaterium]